MIDLKEIKDISLETKQVDINSLITIEHINGYQRVLVNKQLLKSITGYDSINDIFNLYDNKTRLTDFSEIDKIRNKKGELRLMDFNNFTGLISNHLRLNNHHKDLLKNNKVIKTPINEDFLNKKAYLNNNILINVPADYLVNKELKVTNFYGNQELSKNLQQIITFIKQKHFSKVDALTVNFNGEFTYYNNDNYNKLSYWDIFIELDNIHRDIINNTLEHHNLLYSRDVAHLAHNVNDLLLKYILSKLNEDIAKGLINKNKIESFHRMVSNYKGRNFTTLVYYILRENWSDFHIWIVEFLELFQEFYENKMSIIKNEYEVLGDAPYNNFKRDFSTVADFVTKLVILHNTKANFIENHVLLDYCCERSLTTSNNFPFQQFLSIITSTNTQKFKVKLLQNLFYKVKKNKLNSLILNRIGDLLLIELNSKQIEESITVIKYAKSYYKSSYKNGIGSVNGIKIDSGSGVLMFNEIARLFNDGTWNKNNITIIELKNLLTVEEYFDAIFFVGIFDFINSYNYYFTDYSTVLNTFLDKYISFIKAINNSDVKTEEDCYITLKGHHNKGEFTIEFNKYLINGYAKS